MRKIWNLSFTSLVSEDGKSWSLGRISFWILFAYATYFWFFVPASIGVPSSLVQLLITSFTYNIAKKAVVAYSDKNQKTVIDTKPAKPDVQINKQISIEDK